MGGHVAAYRHYLSLGGRDIEDMLRAAGTDPRPYRGAIRDVLSGGVKPGDAVAGLLKSVGAKKLLFPRDGARIAADGVDAIAQGLAAVRLAAWYRLLSDVSESMDAECGPLDADGYRELRETLYADAYAKPGRPDDPSVLERLDRTFRHVSDKLDGDVDVLLRDSHGPAVGAARFAAQDMAFVLDRLSDYEPFGRADPLLVLEALRRVAAGYGCAVEFSGVSRDDVRRAVELGRGDLGASAEAILAWLSFVGLD